MPHRRLVLAVAAAAAIVLSAPWSQLAFDEVANRWPGRLRAVAIGATAAPAALAVLAAIWRIRTRRAPRLFLVALSLGTAAAYIALSDLIYSERFHFVEYGVLGLLFYRVWRPRGDLASVLLPIFACVIVGCVDEWFQWFIPRRAGEARDVMINAVAGACGVAFAAGVDPPDRLDATMRPGMAERVAVGMAAVLVIYLGFFYVVHVGYEIADPEIGSFRSRFTMAELERAGGDRTVRWRTEPPIAQPRVGREDQYLSEGLWHVRERNESWARGDVAWAWRENRILEKFYVPVLDTPTYANPAGHRWSPEQRSDAAVRVGTPAPLVSDRYTYPLYVWRELSF